MKTALSILICVLWACVAQAQSYSFPTSSADYGSFYPTAYMDHSGRDWACGSVRYYNHRGSDYGVGGFAGMDAGRDVVAAAAGTVIRRNDGISDRCTSGECGGGSGFGNYVYIQHANGRVTIYAHLKRWSVIPNVGDVVSCGQKLGEVGSSGNSTGPHLHFQVNSPSGGAVDPFDGSCSGPPTYWVSQGAYQGRPGRSCPSSGSCHPVGTLSCGQSFTASNNGAGSRSEVASYGCSPWQTTGRETSWTFRTPVREAVTLRMTGLSADIDLFVTSSSSCNGSNCVTSSYNGDNESEAVTFTATANATYTVVADGYAGANSNFTLSAQCTGGVPNYRAQLVSQTGFPSGTWTVAPGEVVTGTVRLTNTGRATWSNGNVRIGTTGPRDRTSPFRHSSWLGASRVASNSGAVGPNASRDYTVRLQAPQVEGRYTEQFGLVAEGITWFANQGGPADNMLSWTIDVVDPTPDYRAELVDVAGVVAGGWTVDPGQELQGSLTVRNTGAVTWQPGSVSLATVEPRDRVSPLAHPDWISLGRIASNASVTAPGQTATFDLPALAPSTEAVFTEALGLVAGESTWFADQGETPEPLVDWDLTVAEPYRAELLSVSGLPVHGDVAMIPGETLTASVVVANRGTATWQPGELRLATTVPRGHISPFADSSWLDTTNPAANSAPVGPGDTAILMLSLTAPQTEALYSETLGFALGVDAWFADAGGPADDQLHWDITVMERLRAEVIATQGVPASGRVRMGAGDDAIVQLDIRNTGSETWALGALHVVTSAPRGHDSPVAHPTWDQPSSPRANRAAVATGEQAAYTFLVQGPQTPGTYPVHLELMADSERYLADQGGPFRPVFDFDVVIPDPRPILAAEVVSVVGLEPWQATAGDTRTAEVTLRNIGVGDWVPGDVRIATTGPRYRASALISPGWIAPSRVAAVDGPVAVGETWTVDLVFTAPETPGTYLETFGLLSESLGWFADHQGPADDALVFDVQVSEPDADTERVDDDTEPSLEDDSDTTPSASDTPSTSQTVTSCGCAHGPTGTGSVVFLLLGALAYRRRDRG
jgi:uncharacterized protein (TIGR03382 family)